MDGSIKPPPIVPMLAVDVSGNRYELNPATRAIDKYDPSGVIQVHSIAQGALQLPTNLTVDKSGNIYVIDNHILKKITAVPDTGQAANSSNAATAPAAPPAQSPAASKPPTLEPDHE